MMNKGKIEFCKETERQAVNVLQKETPKPIIIYYWKGGQQAPTRTPIHPIPKVMIKVPTPFRYTNDKVVPWNYTNHVVLQEPQAVRVSPEIKQEPSVNNIVGTGGLTHSGRCYALGLLRVKEEGEHIE